MENITYRGQTYTNIYKYTPDILLKYSKLSIELWNELIIKKLKYLNTPEKIEEIPKDEKNIYYGYNSIVYLPYLKNYSTLYNEQFTIGMSTKEILLLLKKNLQIIKDMHKNNVIHADLYPDNIMINKDLDIQFIDLDYSVINDNDIPYENVYYSYEIPYKSKRSLTRIQDKIDILDIYMYYLVNGNFKREENIATDISSLNLQKYIKEEINSYINNKRNPNRNYYFIDIVDELISTDFTSPILEKRKVL